MNKLLSVICCFAALLACQDIQSQKEVVRTTKTGYKYVMEKDEPGAVIAPGQYALIHTVVTHGDSVIADTRKYPGRPTIVKIETDPARRQGGSGPVQDLLELCSKGDSALLYYPVDSFRIKPKEIKDFDEVSYHLSVVDVFRTDEEKNAYETAEREKINAPMREARQRENEVGAMMTEFQSAYAKGQKTKELKTTESGLKYIILEKSGTGIKANPGETVNVNYYGVFADSGKQFDNSFARGEALSFPLGRGMVIKGWEEAFTLLEKGDKAVIVVPSLLAYGDKGYYDVIPPNADLIFYVELDSIGDNN